MNPFWFYAMHLVFFFTGALVLRRMERQSVSVGALTAVTLGLSTVAFGFLWAVSNPHGEELFSDFIRAYYSAGGTVLHTPEKIGELLKANHFVNLPALAWLFAPFALIKQPQTAAWFFTALGLLVLIIAWRTLAELAHLNHYRAALLFFVFAANGPLCYNFKEGNSSQMVFALVAAAMLFLRRKQDLLAGIFLGIAAVLKLPLLLFGVYFLARGHWRAAAGGAIVVVSTALLSLMLYGWQLNIQWWTQCVQPFTRDPMAAYNVQSIYGFFARLQFGDLYLMDWEPHELKHSYQWIMKTALAAIYALSVLVMTKRASGQKAQELEYLIVFILALVASPMTWSHYYLWLLLPACFLIGRTGHFPDEKIAFWLGWASVALASLPVMLPYTSYAVVMDFFVRFFLSHFLWAGLLMLALLLRARWKAALSEGIR